MNNEEAIMNICLELNDILNTGSCVKYTPTQWKKFVKTEVFNERGGVHGMVEQRQTDKKENCGRT